MQISVRHDFDRARRILSDLQSKQLPYATALALNDAANAARLQITADLPRIFDRPTPFTLRALGVQRASKTNLQAVVFIRPLQAEYLKHEELGGTRSPSENTIKPGASALILPDALKLNQFGNIPAGQIKRLVAQLSTGDTSRAPADRQDRRRKALRSKRKPALGIFYLKGHGPGGVGPGGFFKRLPDHRIQRLLSFVAESHYIPRFHYRTRVARAASAAFAPALLARLREALATAK